MNFNKKLFSLYLVFFLSSVGFVFAQFQAANFRELSDNLTTNVLASGATMLITAAFLFFFYGLIVFIYGRLSNKGEMSQIAKGKQFMLWGLIALFVMVSVWGIVRFAQGLLNLNATPVTIKKVNIVGGSGSQNIGTGQSNASSTQNPNQSTDFLKQEGESCVGKEIGECASGLECFDDNYKLVDIGKSGKCRKISGAKVTEYVPNRNFPDSFAGQALFQQLQKFNCIPIGMSSLSGSVYTQEYASLVKAFQSMNGINPDGIIKENDQTYKALQNTLSKKCLTCSTNSCLSGYECFILKTDSSFASGVCVPKY